MSPTHDMIIDNSTGANVRADINNALAALVSNSSSSSEPATKYAYMWWADTTNGILKIRNSANNAWVELLQLDGTLTLEDGSASTPALAFRDDLNTGIFSSAADTFNVATAGVERMELGATTVFNEDGADVDFRIEGDTDANAFVVDASSNYVGVGIATPAQKFQVYGNSGVTSIAVGDNSTTQPYLLLEANETDNECTIHSRTNNALTFKIATDEKVRIDSSGRFMINMSTSVTGGKFQVNNTFNTFFAASNDAQGCVLQLQKTRSTSPSSYTIVQDGDKLGELQFKGSNGSGVVVGASLQAIVNGTPGSGNDLPTDLAFRVMPDGSGSTQEAMRISSDNTLEIAAEGAIAGFTSSEINSGAPLKIYRNNSSNNAVLQLIWDHFNTTAGIAQKIQFTIGDDASADSFKNAGYIGIMKLDSWQSGAARSSALTFATTASATEGEKMRLDNNGRLLIGTTSVSPANSYSDNLVVSEASANAGISIHGNNSNSNYASIYLSDAGTASRAYLEAQLGSGTSTNFTIGAQGITRFLNNGSERMRIDSTGRVLIGTTSTTFSTSSFGIGLFNDGKLEHSRNVNGSSSAFLSGGNAGQAKIFGDGDLQNTNNSYGQLSDETLKQDIVDAATQWNDIKNLRVRKFRFKDNPTGALQIGVIAQEIETVSAGLVKTNDEGIKSVKYSVLYMKSVKALQEAIAKIETLETKVAALEAA